MKTIFKSFMVIAAASMAFTGCSKDEGTDFIPESPKQLSINATAYAPASTRAAIGDKSDAGYPVTWDETTETFKVVEIAGEKVSGYKMTEDSYSNNDGVASFEFELNEAEADTYKYYAISPAPTSTGASQSTAFIHATIPASQTQTDKVDHAAIVLVGASQEYDEQGNNGSVEFTFEHVTGYAKMTIKGVELTDGQTVEKVTFTAPSEIAGNLYQYKINGTANQFGTGSSKMITVNGLNVDAAAAAEGFDVWFGVAPVEGITEFTVDVYAKDEVDPIATKTANASEKPLTFTAGHISTFSVTVEKAIIETETYEQITSLSNFEDGYYIISATKDSNEYVIANSITTSNAPSAIALDAKLKGTTITAGDTDKYNWYIKATNGGYTIRSAAEPDKYIYLYCTDTNNGVRISTTKMVWDIAASTDNSFNISAVPNSSSRYLSLYSNQDWRVYTSTNTTSTRELKLFKKVGNNTWTGAEEEVQEPAVTQHQGTQDDPFSVADAIAKAKEAGTTGTSELYYIKGKISSIKYTFSAQYGTATFDIVDEGESATLTAYTLKYFNNTAWVEGNTQINVGDEVVIYGNIVNYKDTTPEATNGYLYSLNGETGSTGGGTEPEQPTPGDDGVDILTVSFIGASSGNAYSNWDNKIGNSGAVYAGNTADNNGRYIQLRSSSNSGIVTTATGGTVKKVVVTWNSETSSTGNRTLDVYCNNEAYSSAADLYNTSTQGTKVGSITCGSGTELTIDGDYKFIGLRSNNGAMYLDEIQITWEN